MLYAIIIVLAFLTVYLLCRLFCVKRELHNVAKELHQITGALEENRIVKLTISDKQLEELLTEINSTLMHIRKVKLEYDRKEKDFQREIENISHDLRTPLTAILGYLEMMKESDLSEENRRTLDIVWNRARKMQELINCFYELSQVTSVNYRLEKEAIDISKLLREMVLEQYVILEKKDLEVEIQLPNEPVMIQGNKEALERIFSNLFQNVQRYALEMFRISLHVEEDKVKINFLNGIEEKNIVQDPKLLFERFYMAERARKNGGSGLGLTIAAEFVKHMKGKIRAVNIVEKGQACLNIELEFFKY